MAAAVISPVRRPSRRATAELDALPRMDATEYAIVAHA
jgi:hypothetical protein